MSDLQNHYPRLMQFLAGKMIVDGKRVSADTRKGRIYLELTDDGFVNLCWEDLITGKKEDEYLVVPNDAIFCAVENVRGRVYELKFTSSAHRAFFWIQEPEKNSDSDLCKMVNHFIKNPSTQKETTESPKPKSIPAITPPTQEPDIDLNDLFDQKTIDTLLQDDELCQLLISHLPKSLPRTKQELKDTLKSTHFKQCVGNFAKAVHYSDLNEILKAVGVEIPKTSAHGLREFLKAFVKHFQ